MYFVRVSSAWHISGRQPVATANSHARDPTFEKSVDRCLISRYEIVILNFRHGKARPFPGNFASISVQLSTCNTSTFGHDNHLASDIANGNFFFCNSYVPTYIAIIKHVSHRPYAYK